MVSGLLFAQDLQVKGKVTDATNGDLLPGVTVQVKGTLKGTVTSIDGTFSMSCPQGSVLSFSYLGYKNQEVTVNQSQDINIALTLDVKGLDEVVVIGYGTVKKSDATGSVSVVSSKDFDKGAITTADQLIVGKNAGVVITSNDGSPGAGSTIRIRGGSSLSASNDPLIVIDGVPVDITTSISGSSNPLSIVNPNDIESFTILKDASATAIYGSRASNGVIMITTKKGSTNKGIQISYNGNVSVATVTKYVDVLTGDQMRTLANSLRGKDGLGIDTTQTGGLWRLGTANTNWQKQIYQTALSQDHDISISGNTLHTPYRLSLGYTDQEGVLKTTDMKRYSLSFNVNPSFFDDQLKLNFNGKGTYTNQNYGNYDAIGSSVRFDPTQPVFNNNTRYGGYTTWTNDGTPNGDFNQMATSNPLAMLNLTDNLANVQRAILGFQADYKFHFLPDLHAVMNTSIDASNSSGHNNVDTMGVWTRRTAWGQILNYTQEIRNSVFNFNLHYSKELTPINSSIDVLGGYEWSHNWQNRGSNTVSIVSPGHPLINVGSDSLKTENYIVSFFGRLNYTLMDRYLLTFTLRDDGSSRFAPGNQWGLFPSAAFAWKINDEDFLKDVAQISELKLRLGWGQTGQQNIFPGARNADYPAMGYYETASTVTAYYQLGNKFVQTMAPLAYDANIKWETTTTNNIGLDFGFLKNRISGSFDYYNRITDNLIENVQVPNGSNFSNYVTTNIGSLKNNGYEVSLNLKPISTKDYGWDFGVNFYHNTNEITKLLKKDDPTYIGFVPLHGGISGGVGNNILINSVGYPANSFFVNKQVYDKSGNPIEGLYVDLSGKGGATAGVLSDMYRYKSPAPEYVLGFNTRFFYKSFDITASARANIGNYVYNNVASQSMYYNLYQNSFWQNLSTSIYKTKFVNAQYFSDYFVENASFFRLDNISIGYNFEKLLKDKLNGRVSLTAQNVLVITKYSGLDPEVSNGIDNNMYPRPRVILLGLNLNF
jgi:iron complex outermembrane receptor protein